MRDEVGLRAPWGSWTPASNPDLIVVHHGVFPHGATVADGRAAWRAVQGTHYNLRNVEGYIDIAYNAGISRAAEVMEGRPWNKRPGATAGVNHRSLAICRIANAQTNVPGVRTDPWNDGEVEAARWCIAEMQGIWPSIRQVGYHRMYQATACPGDLTVARWGDIMTPWAPQPMPEPEPPVEVRPVILQLDAVEAAYGGTRVAGWAFDPARPTVAATVEVSVRAAESLVPVTVTVVGPAAAERADVAAHLAANGWPTAGALHGYDVLVPHGEGPVHVTVRCGDQVVTATGFAGPPPPSSSVDLEPLAAAVEELADSTALVQSRLSDALGA